MTRAGPLWTAGLVAALAPILAPARAADEVPASSPASTLAVTIDRFEGTARGRDGAVLYLEEHEVRRAGDRPLSAVTTYRDRGGRVRAVLRTDFSRSSYAPDYRLEDLDRALVEEVTVSADTTTLVAGARRRTLALPRGPGSLLVTGQGLDRLVRARLADLEAGAQLQFDFAIPSRLDAYGFRVRALPGREGDTTVRIRVEIESWVLRLFASGLDTEYDRATRRLVRYRGLSNLADERGENPEVVITYAYPGEGAAGLRDPHAPL